MGAGPANVDTLTAATLDRYVANVAENVIFGQMRTLKLLIEKGRKAEGSGTKIRQPVLYKEGYADEFGKWDVLPQRQVDPITDAEYDRVQYEGDIVLNKFDLIENSGKEKRLDYAKEMADCAMLSLRNKIQNHFVAQIVTGANRLTCLHDLMSSTVTIGGINPATYTWWAPQYSPSAAPVATFITNDLGRDAMQSLYIDCQKRTGKSPDLGPCHQSVWEAIIKAWKGTIATPVTLRLSDESMLKAGIENIKFNSCSMYYEPDMGKPTVGATAYFPLYMLQSSDLKIWVTPEYDFVRTPDVSPTNQPQVFLSYILWRGCIGWSNRNSSGRVLFTAVS